MASLFYRDNIQSVILLIYLLVYTFANVIVGEEGNMMMVSLIKFGLLFLFFVVSYRSKVSNDIKKYKALLILLFCFVVLQVVVLANTNVIKILGLNLLIFVMFFKWSNNKVFRVWTWGMRFMTVIASISVASLAIIFGEIIYYRQDALIDKGFMTVFYSMSFIYCLTDILFHKNVKSNLFILIFIFCVDFIFVQSKISLLVLLVVYILSVILKIVSIRKSLVYMSVGIFVLLIIPFFLPSDSIALDPVKDAVNRGVGTQIFEIKGVEVKSDTYDVRSDIWSYCLTELFPSHPILGIGLGNFSEYSKKGPISINDLEETESSLLAVITEGGVVYFILMTLFFFITIKHICLRYKRKHSYVSFTGICLFVSYMIMMIGNDFFDSLFWIQAGLMIGLLSPIKYKRNMTQLYPINLK